MTAVLSAGADDTGTGASSRVRWPWVALLVAGGALIALVVRTIPWNMDEFVQYHVLACTQASQQLNVYRDSCLAYPTALGGWTFHRSYDYIGVTSSVLLWPFLAVTHSLRAHYAEGVVALVLVAAGIALTLRLGRAAIPVLLLFFPLTFTVLHDAGPVRVGLLVLAWTPVVVRRYVVTARWPAKAGLAALVIVAWLVATEDKPFFLYLIPGIALWALAGLAAHHRLPTSRSAWASVAGLFVVATGMCLALLVALRVDGGSYLAFLTRSVPATDDVSRATNAVWGLLFTLDWPFYAHRVSDFSRLGSSAYPEPWRWLGTMLPLGTTGPALAALGLTLLVVVTLTAVGVRSFRRLRRDPSRDVRVSAALLLGSALALGVVTVAAGGSASHHFVYLQVPLVGALALAATRSARGLLPLGGLFATLSAAALVAIWCVPAPPTASREIPVVFAAAQAAADRNSVINCGSWGCYYAYSLVNENGIPVVFAASRSDARRLARETGRRQGRILHLCLDCDLGSVQRLYPEAVVRQLRTDTSEWELFEVDPGGS
jgi:hypothetical protein